MAEREGPLVLPSVPFEEWSGFLDGRRPASGVLQPLWQRSRSLGAPPEHTTRDAVVDACALHERRDRADRLLRCAAVLDAAAQRLAKDDHVLLLCDLDGVVLRRWGGGAFAAVADDVRLIEGSVWAEDVRGTNAIGTALAEERSVICEGRAHFARDHHGLACYAHLIRDEGGRPVAVLDATSDVSRYRPALAQVLFGAARELELALHHEHFVASATLRTAARMLQRARDPGVVVKPDGDVLFSNAAAKAALAELRHAPSFLATLNAMALGQTPSLAGAEEVGLECDPVDDHFVVRWRPADRPRPAFSARVDSSPHERPHLYQGDPAVRAAVAKAERFAPTTLPVLLLAETGTGKELLAKTIHEVSHRSAGPFVALNCGAFPPNLVESELFGYASGAFTGAQRGGRSGRIEQSAGGTLFLDEVAELPLRVQAALLRVLEDGTFFPVGGGSPRHVDLRLVCATCRDLVEMVDDGRFRADLYYRIRGVTLSLPPVRARTDLEGLAYALLATLAAEVGKPVPRLSDAAWARLVAHRWPGNVRELKHALHHALVLADDLILVEHLPLEPVDAPAEVSVPPSARSEVWVDDVEARPLREVEATAIRAVLDRHGGNVSAAARELGIARSTLYRKARRFGLDV